MELVEYYDPQSTKEVKQLCGLTFVRGKPTRVFDDDVVKRLLRSPSVFRIVEKTDADKQVEKAHEVSLISLQERIVTLEEKIGLLAEIKEDLLEIKKLFTKERRDD